MEGELERVDSLLLQNVAGEEEEGCEDKDWEGVSEASLVL